MDFLSTRKDLKGEDIVDNWKLLLTEEEILKCVEKCAAYINEHFEGKDIVLTCILKGASYFFIELAKRIVISCTWYFIEASSYKDDQTQDHQIEILSVINPSKFKGKQVILIDELFDNGFTMSEIKKHIAHDAHLSLDDVFCCALFKKKHSIYGTPDLFGIEVPNVWLVGYGLDDKQEKRGWSHLFACPKTNDSLKTEDDALFDSEENYKKIRSALLEQINYD